MTIRQSRLRTDHARVQVTNEQMKSIAKSALELSELFYKNTQPVGMPILLFTDAKAYCRGGGWWDIMGYAYDGQDVQRVLDRLAAVAEPEQLP